MMLGRRKNVATLSDVGEFFGGVSSLDLPPIFFLILLKCLNGEMEDLNSFEELFELCLLLELK
jgi:hypothetical protein